MYQIFNRNDVRTEKGDVAHSSTGSAVVDFMFRAPVARGQHAEQIRLFNLAWREDPLFAAKALFWLRDVRGGAGERDAFRAILLSNSAAAKAIAVKNVAHIAEYGRWDDVVSLLDSPIPVVRGAAMNAILHGVYDDIRDRNSLIAKWLPSESSRVSAKRAKARAIAGRLGWAMRTYRSYLSTRRSELDIVESRLSGNRKGAPDFQRVPSRAFRLYAKAFANVEKRDWSEAYAAFLAAVERGDKRIHSTGVTPGELIKGYNNAAANGQWADMIRELSAAWKDRGVSVLPVIDSSGSMTAAPAADGIMAMQHAAGIGGVIAAANASPLWRNLVCTFSNTPAFYKMDTSSPKSAYNSVLNRDWGGTTNYTRVFEQMIRLSRENGVTRDEFPTAVLVLSDMQFDLAFGGASYKSSHSRIVGMFNNSGYRMPTVIYWNLAARRETYPVKINEQGVVLISGFSHQIFKDLVNLNLREVTPADAAIELLSGERYAQICI